MGAIKKRTCSAKGYKHMRDDGIEVENNELAANKTNKQRGLGGRPFGI